MTFGNFTTPWDQLFGTYLMSTDRHPDQTVGLDRAHNLDLFPLHLALPLTLRRYQPEHEEPVLWRR